LIPLACWQLGWHARSPPTARGRSRKPQKVLTPEWVHWAMGGVLVGLGTLTSAPKPRGKSQAVPALDVRASRWSKWRRRRLKNRRYQRRKHRL